MLEDVKNVLEEHDEDGGEDSEVGKKDIRIVRIQECRVKNHEGKCQWLGGITGAKSEEVLLKMREQQADLEDRGVEGDVEVENL